jgi:arylsulfatase A-like enzyme
MNRRQFVQGSVAAGLASNLHAQAVAKAPRKRPNILYIFDDEHRAVSLPGEPGCTELLAPNLDAFRRANFSMNQCISNYPLCSPHRAVLMTGVWPYQNGVTRNWVELGTDHLSLGQVFSDHGYRTSYVGKWHLAGPGIDRGGRTGMCGAPWTSTTTSRLRSIPIRG